MSTSRAKTTARTRRGPPDETGAQTFAKGNSAAAAELLPRIARELIGLNEGARKATGAELGAFGLLADTLPALVWATDEGGRCTFVNARWVEFTGRTLAAGSGDGWLEAVHPDDRPGWRSVFREALAARREFRLEYRLWRYDGVYRWVNDAGAPRFAPDGALLGYLGTMTDITERKLAEDAAREAEEGRRFAGVTARLGEWSWDAATDMMAFSDRGAEILGMTAGRRTTWTGLGELVHPDDRERVRVAMEAATTGRVDFEAEYRIRAVAGGWSWVAARGRGRLAVNGSIVGVSGVVQDITERKRNEERMRESETQLQLATKAGKFGIWDWDIAANEIAWTDSLYEIHGVKRGAAPLTMEGFAALVHPDDRAPVQRAIESSLTRETPCELEFRAVRPGGATVWLHTQAVVLCDAGQARRMLGATFDITARKRAELASKESEARFRALASHAPVGIFLTDTNGNTLFLNDAWRALAGLAPEQARGQGWVDTLHPDDRERVAQEWGAAVQQRRPFHSEHRFQRADGSVRWVQGSAVEYRNAHHAQLGYIGTIVDITERKLAEEALRESEKRFRTLAGHAPVGIFLTDPQGETIFVNERWCAMTGLDATEGMGRGWSRAMHPDDRARVAAEWTEALAQNRASSAEYRFIRADGTVTWVQGNAVQQRDDAGRLIGYIGTVADLTQRKAAEERLQAREAQLRLITTKAPILLAHCDREQRYLFANSAYAERFGVEAERIVGRTMAEVMGAEVHAALRPFIARVLAGEAVEHEIEVPFREGGRRTLHVSHVPDFGPDEAVRGWLSAISDVTERRMMEDALRQTEARFRQLADSMPQIVFAADARGNTDYYNRRWFELTGAREGVTGDESFLPSLHPDDRQRFLDTWYASVATGQQFQIEYRLRFPAREEHRWHLGRALPVRDNRGRIVRWFGTCTDIHDWKLVQEKLRQAQSQLQAHADELEQRVAERTASLREAIVQMEEFSYSVSHDLRAPLRAMNAYAQALVEDYGPRLDDTARNYLERIQRSSVRMEKLTHDVLTYSRVARAEVTLKPIDLEGLLRDVVLQYRELQPPAAELRVESPLLEVRGHESSLGQSLTNLLMNAVKFVEGGVKPAIVVRTEMAGARVRLWIEDNGIGIAPEYQARLFRVFERVPTRQSYDGTGIGLAVVRKAVEKMGGACGVVSDGRTGSRFWIELPKGQP